MIPTAYRGYKDVSKAWEAKVLQLDAWPVAGGEPPEVLERAEGHGRPAAEQRAIVECRGELARSMAERAVWRCLMDAAPRCAHGAPESTRDGVG